jgi:hypothetical protein
MNQRTASEIERDLDRTRAEMSETIDALQERLSPGQLFEQGMRYFYSGGGRTFTDGAAEFAQNFGRAVRDNPIPFALVATGLAWLMVARGRQRSPGYDLYEDYDEYDALEDYDDFPAVEDEPVERDWPAQYGSAGETRERYERESDIAAPASATAGAPTPTSQAGGVPPHRGALGGSVGAASVGEQRAQEAARRAELASGTERGEHDRDATQRAREAADEARRQAVRAGRAADEASRAADRAGGGPRGGARGRADAAREWAGETAHGARQRMQRAADDTRRGFGRAGRSARRQAQDAASSARHQVRRAGSGLAHLFEERPLLVGAIGLAIGVALGAALPTTRREDEWLGDTRDSLKHRAGEELRKAERVAQRSYETARDEAERQHLTPEGARRAARRTVREAEHAAEDTLKDVEGRMRQVGKAVTEAAKDEAERQHLAGTGSKSTSRETGGDSPGQPGGESPGQKQV